MRHGPPYVLYGDDLGEAKIQGVVVYLSTKFGLGEVLDRIGLLHLFMHKIARRGTLKRKRQKEKEADGDTDDGADTVRWYIRRATGP